MGTRTFVADMYRDFDDGADLADQMIEEQSIAQAIGKVIGRHYDAAQNLMVEYSAADDLDALARMGTALRAAIEEGRTDWPNVTAALLGHCRDAYRETARFLAEQGG